MAHGGSTILNDSVGGTLRGVDEGLDGQQAVLYEITPVLRGRLGFVAPLLYHTVTLHDWYTSMISSDYLFLL